MKKNNYTASHDNLLVSARRYEQSPYLDKYATDDMLFGIYARRLHLVTAGEDTVEHYWKLRRGVLLFDIPEKPANTPRIASRPVAGSSGMLW